ncbi:MAG TPA: hypothetical protein VLE53_03490 [Gemmatimonadaceae bacterium]|nr:hypothetical protein [Gemmatimonadaceae bacterium]
MGRRGGRVALCLARALVSAALLTLTARAAHGQGPWTLSLFVDPFPSPYQSDWEVNANISTLTIVNPTGVERDVILVSQVRSTQGRILASGRSDPLGIAPGAPTVITAYLDIPGSSQADKAMQDQMERTGRLPEGTYRACVTMATTSGFVLGEDCANFTIVYPDPPMLLAPSAGEALANPAPFFQWTPIQVPSAYQVRYALQIAEVRAHQTAEEALNASIPHFQSADLDVTNLQYPVEGQPFEPGQYYAWRVVALDQNGFPPSANNGSSEIRTFRFDDGTGVNAGMRTEISLSLANSLDHDSTDVTEPTTRTTPVDIGELCSMWDNPPTEVSISSASPIGLRRFAGQPAVLFRDSAATKWWIATKNRSGRRSVLVGGDCDGIRGNTRTRWVASKDSALQARISGMLKASPGGMGRPIASIDTVAFGMVVLALGDETVEVPSAFPEGQAFLQDRTLDAKMGLNLYTVLGLQEWALWPLFQRIGFTEKEIALTGFLGWSSEWHIGYARGADAGTDLSSERDFLVLRADLPRRKLRPRVDGEYPNGGLSFEISVGDSTGRALGGDKAYSLDLEGKVIHTIQLSEEVSLEGSIGLDLSRESNKGPGQEVLARWDFLRGVRRPVANWIGKDGKIASGLNRAIAPTDFEPPETGLDITASYHVVGPIGSLFGVEDAPIRFEDIGIDAKLSPSDSSVTVGLSAKVVTDVGGAGAMVGGSKTFGWHQPRDTFALKLKIDQEYENMSEKVAAVSPEAAGQLDCGGFRDRNHDVCKAMREWQKARKALEDARKPTWRFRASVGHIPLGDIRLVIRDLWRLGGVVVEHFRGGQP